MTIYDGIDPWAPLGGLSDAEIAADHLDNQRAEFNGKVPDALRAQAAPAAAAQAAGRSWRPVDLTDVLNGTYTPPMPTVGARGDGVGLFYPGRKHTIASESEAGKTWFALAAVGHEISNGHNVLYIDFEDDEGGVVGRLLALGADRGTVRERFSYIRPDDALTEPGNRDDLAVAVKDSRPSLIVLDGITEAMALHGQELKDNTDIARFGQMLPTWLAAQGPAVASLDHVVKDREQRGRYAIGGVHKLNGLNGAAYVLDNRRPFGIGITGRSTVYLAKDRPGQLRRNALPSAGGLHWFADLVLESQHADSAQVSIKPPTVGSDQPFRPTVVMAKVAAALEKHGPLSQRKVCAATGGNRQTVIQALGLLQLDGYVSDSTPHELLKPYAPTGDDQ